jgi:hypothetical protein
MGVPRLLAVVALRGAVDRREEATMTEARLKEIEIWAPAVANGHLIGELCAEVRRLREDFEAVVSAIEEERALRIAENDRLRESLHAMTNERNQWRSEAERR